jgi:hypothetical protein
MATKRPDGRVEPGQRISSAFSARAWNRAQDAADVVLGARTGAEAGASQGSQRASNIVLVQNKNIALPKHGVCALESSLILMSGATIDGTNEASIKLRRFSENPILSAAPFLEVGLPFGIAIEPIARLKVGRIAIGGSFVFRVNLTNTTHRFADIKEGDNTQLQSTSCGRVRIIDIETSAGLGTKWAFGVM